MLGSTKEACSTAGVRRTKIGQTRLTTTAEVRLDHGEAARVLDSRAGTPPVWLRSEAIAIECRCGAAR
jgi:hypothetical protein